ncbi:semaphorin-4A-like, partial [Pseudonaja textilis]|uniref:semaphorin-4A-like n=1 Tax=Pseudonaja textilis TaxID=8673 RepID=UPI000EAABAD1
TEWLQDVEQGKAEAVCQRHSGKGRAMPRSKNDSDGVSLKVLTSPFNSLVRLPCPQVSALANYSWTYPEGGLPSQEGLTLRDHTGLLVFVHSRTLGEYACWASENGYRHRVAWYDVRSDLPVDGASSGKGSLEHQAVPVGEWRSYWVQFVTVTVLLSMTLAVAVAVGFFSYHDKLKAKTKVQGCSVPESSRAPVQEKAPLNGSQGPPGGGGYQSQDAADGTKSCCVQVEGGSRAVDTDNNRLNCPLMNGEDTRTGEAI